MKAHDIAVFAKDIKASRSDSRMIRNVTSVFEYGSLKFLGRENELDPRELVNNLLKC